MSFVAIVVFVLIVLLLWWGETLVFRKITDPDQQFYDIPLPPLVNICLLVLSAIIISCAVVALGYVI